jgi:hypothetical protein
MSLLKKFPGILNSVLKTMMKLVYTLAVLATSTTSSPTPSPTPSPLVPVDLGTAGDFVILAETGVSTIPGSVITGDVGVSPIAASAMTGFSLKIDLSNKFATSDQVTTHSAAPFQTLQRSWLFCGALLSKISPECSPLS